MKKLLYKIVCMIIKRKKIIILIFHFKVISEANNIANLHMQISSCDKILEVNFNEINLKN